MKEKMKKRDEEITSLKEQLTQQKQQHERSRSADAARNREARGVTEVQAETIDRITKGYRENNKVIQNEDHYSEGDAYNHYHPRSVKDTLEIGQPQFTTLKFEWTLTRYWVEVLRHSTYII